MVRRELPAQRGEEFRGVREYQPGDDSRCVHWRSTARWDRLMVRQHEAELGCAVCIVVDLRADHLTPDSLERSLEAAASVACTVLAQNNSEVRLTTSLGETSGLGGGQRARAKVLDLLAAASPHEGGTRGPLFGARGEVAVLVSSTEAAARELLARELMRSWDTVIIVLTNEAPLGGEPNASLGRPQMSSSPATLVRAGHGLEAAWAAAFGRPSARNHQGAPARLGGPVPFKSQ